MLNFKTHLSVIQEEDLENEDEKNKKLNKIKKKFLDITKNKKGNLMDSFFENMEKLNQDL